MTKYKRLPKMTDKSFWVLVNRFGPISAFRPDLGRCWLWTGKVGVKTGYGRCGRLASNTHIYTWEQANGSVPEGKQLDHLCRVRLCCNPSHLEPVTCKENLLRGDTLAAKNSQKTKCSKGHPYNKENTRIKISKTGQRRRSCHICNRENQRNNVPQVGTMINSTTTMRNK